MTGAFPAETDADVLARLLAARHSCRAFRPDPVPRPVIERIVRTAGRTASWCNTQPWQLVVTSGAATERFRDALLAQPAAGTGRDIGPDPVYEGAHLLRRRACGYQLYDSVGIARGDREASARQARENLRLFGAPHVAIVSADRSLGPYGAMDCVAFVSGFLLVAESLGVATIAQAALASHAALIRGHLGLPASRDVVCGISFGYEDAAHPANAFRTGRAETDELVTWRDAPPA